MQWFEVLRPTPVLNTPDFKGFFGGIGVPTDANGHPQAYEFIALAGMKFQVLAENGFILKVLRPVYSGSPLYIDRRFGRECQDGVEPLRSIPTAEELLKKMEARLGTAYVWGGNWAGGIPEMLEYYPPSGKLSKRMEELWTMRGLDCSGLLFEATLGATPRNTSQLMKFGREVDDVKPLDMLLYPGHVMFVRDQETIVESKARFGVRIRRIDEIEEKYVIRRFMAESL